MVIEAPHQKGHENTNSRNGVAPLIVQKYISGSLILHK